MKIIDFETKKNAIRFALGADDCNDYWGDDWDDIPYEHNAGPVYSRYVTGYATILVPFTHPICDMEHDWLIPNNFKRSKEDFKMGRAPCLVVDMDSGWNEHYANAVLKKNSVKFYFNDPLEPGTYILGFDGNLKKEDLEKKDLEKIKELWEK